MTAEEFTSGVLADFSALVQAGVYERPILVSRADGDGADGQSDDPEADCGGRVVPVLVAIRVTVVDAGRIALVAEILGGFVVVQTAVRTVGVVAGRSGRQS